MNEEENEEKSSGDEKLQDKFSEEKVIESYDFNKNKDSAEALYYALKKNEIEAQKQFESNSAENEMKQSLDECESDDDDVVMVNSPSKKSSAKMLKYGMSMDDRLLGSILSQDYAQRSKKVYCDDGFDPLLEETLTSHHFLENISETHSQLSEDKMHMDMEDEDQFDDFYPGNIRSKIMASSISIADSDYFDPTNNKSLIDDDKIRTALETIHSTDSESTIASTISAATKIQASDRNLNAHRNNSKFQYSSIGNAAIDKSLDDFIQSQELRIDRFEEEEADSYYNNNNSFNSNKNNINSPSKKQESIEDYTDDTCTESDKKPTGIIEIKLEQKHFLTVDERRRTLHREDAIQRNSTRSNDDESSKSSDTSHEKILDKLNSQSDAIAGATLAQTLSSVVDTEISVPGEHH
jgi:hypothetical protein